MNLLFNNDESGFTLLEALIALLLSSMIMLFLGTSILQLSKINELLITDAQTLATAKTRIKGNRQIEWHLFLNQLENYLENTQLISHTFDSLVVEENNLGNQGATLVKYSCAKTGNLNFCRSKNNGYHEMLTDIKRFNLTIDQQQLTLYFVFKNGEEYKGRMWIDSWNEENPEKE